MAKFHEALTPELGEFIQQQQIFFVASGTDESRINLSPKGMDTLRILDANHVAYLDMTGSGNETAAHLNADGRLTMMLCSFGAAPLILRLYGHGRIVLPGDAEWTALYARFAPEVGARQIIVLTVESLQTSCGFGVPVAEAMHPRGRLRQWCEGKGEDDLAEYRRRKNALSIDGLPTRALPEEAGA
jgi:hypothetical protein